jgi:hypothetical protein
VKSLLHRRPSPALVIACLALFVSLSGVSYGVATGFIDSREIKNNSVRTKDLRNNDIRTRDLRNNQIRGVDIRNSTIQSRDIGINAVTGVDVRESTLQKVPSAAAADTATSATSATTAGSATTVSSLRAVPLTRLPEGGSPVTLVTHGPLTVSAACLPEVADTRLSIRVASTEANSAADGFSNSYPALAPGDGPEEVSFIQDLAAAPRSIGQDTFVAFAPSGKAISGFLALTADAAGAGSCTVHGQIGLQG